MLSAGVSVYLHFLYIDKIMGNGSGKGLINKSCRTGVVVAKIFAVSRLVAEFSNVFLRGPSCNRTAEGMDQITIKTQKP
jgi:hypothetical protein